MSTQRLLLEQFRRASGHVDVFRGADTLDAVVKALAAEWSGRRRRGRRGARWPPRGGHPRRPLYEIAGWPPSAGQIMPAKSGSRPA